MARSSSVSLSMRRALFVGVSYADAILAGTIEVNKSGSLFTADSVLHDRMMADDALCRQTDDSFRVLRVI